MTVTLKHVEFIFQGWLQLRTFLALGNFGPQYSRISMKQSKNSHPVSFFIPKKVCTLLCYTLSLPFSLFPNGGYLNLCIVILPQSGGTVTLLWLFIISRNGMRKFLQMSRMVRLPPFFCLTTSSLGLDFRKP